MQKEIQLTDKTLLVVGLKKATYIAFIDKDELIVRMGYEFHQEQEEIKIPTDYKLLGIYPELTEEQLATIGLDLESFQSLMEREKCYTVNPYGGKRPNLNDYDISNASQDYMDGLQMEIGLNQLYWEEAQQTTFDKYAILIKSK